MNKWDLLFIPMVLAAIALMVLAVMQWSEPPKAHGPKGVLGVYSNAPLPVETYPPLTLTPWCVGTAQFAEFRATFGWQDGPQWNNQFVAEYDFNHDSRISAADFAEFRAAYGRCV